MPKKILVTIEGQTRCISDWAKEKGISRVRIYQRIRAGCTPEQAIIKGRRRIPPPSCARCNSVKTIWKGRTTLSLLFKCNDCGKQSHILAEEAKKRRTLFVTPTAWENIKNEAQNRGIGISELIEEFGQQIKMKDR